MNNPVATEETKTEEASQVAEKNAVSHVPSFVALLRTLPLRMRSLWHKPVPLKERLEQVLAEYAVKQVDASHADAVMEQGVMVRKVLKFSELRVEDIMVPRADIAWVDYASPLEKLLQQVAGNGHSRVPVCRSILDDVVGFLHMKDLVMSLANNNAFGMGKLIREVLFVPPSMKASALLLKMQVSRVHIAVVVDEYGGTTGLITIEDLVEQIVGQIEDEHDEADEIQIRTIGQHVYEVNARLPLEMLMQKLGFTLLPDHQESQEEVNTVGGFITYVLGRLPAVGEVIHYAGGRWEFEVKEADARRIKRVRIRHNPDVMADTVESALSQ